VGLGQRVELLTIGALLALASSAKGASADELSATKVRLA
jgi:hypothetical protein